MKNKNLLSEEIIRTQEIMGLLNEQPKPLAPLAKPVLKFIDDAFGIGRRFSGDANEILDATNALRNAALEEDVLGALTRLTKASTELAEFINPKVYNALRNKTGYKVVLQRTKDMMVDAKNRGMDESTIIRQTEALLDAGIGNAEVREMVKQPLIDDILNTAKTGGTKIANPIDTYRSIIQTLKEDKRFVKYYEKYGVRLDAMTEDLIKRFENINDVQSFDAEALKLFKEFAENNKIPMSKLESLLDIFKRSFYTTKIGSEGKKELQLAGWNGTSVKILTWMATVSFFSDLSYRMAKYDEGFFEAASNTISKDFLGIPGGLISAIRDKWKTKEGTDVEPISPERAKEIKDKY